MSYDYSHTFWRWTRALYVGCHIDDASELSILYENKSGTGTKMSKNLKKFFEDVATLFSDQSKETSPNPNWSMYLNVKIKKYIQGDIS